MTIRSPYLSTTVEGYLDPSQRVSIPTTNVLNKNLGNATYEARTAISQLKDALAGAD